MPTDMTQLPCPACASTEVTSFFETSDVPVHTTLLMPSRQHALDYPKGQLELAYCKNCGFISNLLFEKGIHEYSPRCEESQGYSATFANWMEDLAKRLVKTYDIHQQTVVEIGSGKGEFLSAVCRQGNNTGIGYDPAYVPGRLDGHESARIDFRKQLWSVDCTLHGADLVVCRHTLEHIPDVADFLRDVHACIADKPDTLLFFEVPDVMRVLHEGAFWDIYYEHCSYFSRDSLVCLFQNVGFEVLESWLDYDDQYVLLAAKPASDKLQDASVDPVPEIVTGVGTFREHYRTVFEQWSSFLEKCAIRQQSVMLWGGGSKAAAFLNQVDINSEIDRVIDINPNKHHAFIPGTGQEVVGPGVLLQNAPDFIIVMNPVYLDEIQVQLDSLACDSRLMPI